MIEVPSVYNVILKRPTLNQAKAIVSIYNLVVKFLTPRGAGILRRDQAIAQSCYVSSLRRDTTLEALNIDEIDPREEKDKVSSVEELT